MDMTAQTPAMGAWDTGPDQGPNENNVPFYLAPAVQQKIAVVAKASGTPPDQLVSNIKQSIASGKSDPQHALQTLDQHVANATQQQPAITQTQAYKDAPDSAAQDWLKPLVGLSDAVNHTDQLKGYQAPATKADLIAAANKTGAAQTELLGRDPTSQISQNARAATMAALKSALPGQDVSKMVPDSMSANDIENNANLKSILSGGYGVQGNQAKAAAMSGRVDVMKGNQGLAVSKEINADMLPYNQISDKLQKGSSILNDPNVSTQRLAEVAQDYSSALNNGSISSDFKLKNISTDGIMDHVNRMVAFATNNPDQPAPKAEVDYWKKFGQSLEESNSRLASQKAKNLMVGKDQALSKNPQALAAAQAVANNYQKGTWNNTQPKTYDPDVMQYAQAHGISNDQALAIKNKRMGGQ